MSHSTQQDFILYTKNKFPNYFTNSKVLEVGSLDINGSMRSFFSECDYLGIDVGEGQGVDLVVTSKSNKNDYDEDFNNLYGLVETISDYSDIL